jgi:hypothetical protein
VALRVVDAETGQHLDDLRVLSELGYRLLAGLVPNPVDLRDYVAGVRLRCADRPTGLWSRSRHRKRTAPAATEPWRDALSERHAFARNGRAMPQP